MSMQSPGLETVLARLFTDADFLTAFLDDPRGVAEAQGLDPAERDALCAIDRPGLMLAARSFAVKRSGAKRTTSWRAIRLRWRT